MTEHALSILYQQSCANCLSLSIYVLYRYDCIMVEDIKHQTLSALLQSLTISLIFDKICTCTFMDLWLPLDLPSCIHFQLFVCDPYSSTAYLYNHVQYTGHNTLICHCVIEIQCKWVTLGHRTEQLWQDTSHILSTVLTCAEFVLTENPNG